MVDYYVAFTSSPGGERERMLHRAAAAFDAIYQTNRVDANQQVSVIGLYVHWWHGKVKEDLGQWQDAVDIYDEVLASAPDSEVGSLNPVLSAMYAEVEHFRLAQLARHKAHEAANEARTWLATYRPWKDTAGYQAIQEQFGGKKTPGGKAASAAFNPLDMEGCFATAAAIAGNQ
jgi:hypothetical protein